MTLIEMFFVKCTTSQKKCNIKKRGKISFDLGFRGFRPFITEKIYYSSFSAHYGQLRNRECGSKSVRDIVPPRTHP